MLAISCQDDDNEVAKKYQVTLTAQANGSDISTLSDFQIQLTNAAGEVIKLTQDENSEFVYSGKVIAGTYNAQASASNDEFNFFRVQFGIRIQFRHTQHLTYQRRHLIYFLIDFF